MEVKLHTLWEGTTSEDVLAAESEYLKDSSQWGALSSVYYGFATDSRAKDPEDATGSTYVYREYIKKAEGTSDEFAKKHGNTMIADQLDIRQTILREVGRHAEALAVAEKGLGMENIPLHTKGLLLVGKAEALQALGNDLEGAASIVAEIKTIAETVAQSDDKNNKNQAIRLYRALVRYYKSKGATAELQAAEKAARELISQTGAEGQKKKLEYDLLAT